MKIAISISLVLASVVAFAQPTVDIVEYINAYKSIAVQEMQRSGVPAAIKLAQGIHETYAGKSELVLKSNNHFGIKCKTGWTGSKTYHDDDERGECFRVYSSPLESYADHSNFLKGSPRYASLFSLSPEDYKGWAYGLKKAGYATNNKYPQIIIRLIEEYNLQQYSLIALGKLAPQEEIIVSNLKAEADIPTVKQIVQEATTPAEEALMPPPVIYPQGQFLINNTRVIYASKGTSLLALAQEHEISYSRLLDFNDLRDKDVLERDQLVYLQRKRKAGANEIHVVQPGETVYEISQKQGIRIEALLEYNYLQYGMEPAPGEKLYCREKSPGRPVLVSEITKKSAAVPSIELQNPSSAKHIVQTKETLYSIARKYGLTVEELKAMNNLPADGLHVGQELVVSK
jgi:LysM repeat protein